MAKRIKSIMYTEEQIAQAVDKIAAKLNEEYKDEELILVLVLKGSVPFCADLMRKLKMPVVMDVMKASSYGAGTASTGVININLDIKSDIKGKNVVIVEDIIDSGNTLYRIRELFSLREPKSLKIVTFLDKPERREADIDPDLVGFTIPNEFVVGYGMDFDEHYRELPYIAILEDEC